MSDSVTPEQMDSEQAVAWMTEKVGSDLYTLAATEVDGCIPPWTKEGVVRMDVEAIRTLMIACWLRGYVAKGESLS